MASKKSKHSPAELARAKKNIWLSKGVEGWIEYLKAIDPTPQWRRSDARTIKALCPFHSEKTPSFIIQLEKGRARCFGADCGVHYADPIKFLADLTKASYKDTLDQILKDFDRIPPILKEASEEVNKRHKEDELKNYIYRIAKECLQDARTARSSGKEELIDEYSYAEPTLSWLDTRRIPEEFWHHLSIGILPSDKHLEYYFSEFIKKDELLEDARSYLKKVNTSTWIGSLMLAYHSTPSQVCRFKLRKPDDKFSEGQRAIFIEEEAEMKGYFGLATCEGMRTEGLIVFVVEGEFDQMSIQLASMGAFKEEGNVVSPHREIVVATGGSYHSSLNELYDTSFTEARIISDNPLYQGKEHTAAVMKGTESELDVKIFVWPQALASVKDPDKAVHMFDTVGPRAFLNQIYDDDNYITPREWCINQIEESAKEYNKEKDEEFLVSRIQNYTSVLNRSEQKDLFIRDACEKFNVDRVAVTQTIVRHADEETFVHELEKLILEDFVPIGTKTEGGNAKLTVWSKKKKIQDDIYVTRIRDSSGILARSTKNIYTWIKGRIGIPTFVRELDTRDPAGLPKIAEFESQTRKLEFFISQAMQNISATVPPDSQLIRKQDGIHIMYTATEGYTIYFNNGGHLFEGKLRESDGNRYAVDWAELDRPLIQNKYLFEFETAPWSRNRTTADLKAGEEGDLLETYNTVKNIITSGWSFENGDLDPQILAAFVMVCPICSIFPKRPALFVTAEKASGKSKLTLGLFGGIYSSVPRLIEHSVSSVNISQAGIYQTMVENPKLFIGDEFEEDNRAGISEMTYRSLWNILRTAADSGYVTRGSASGKPRQYFVSFPFILSAINLTSNSANLSRIIPIIMKHQNKHVDPGLALAKLGPQAYFEDLSKLITTICLSHVPNLMTTYYKLQTKYLSGEALGQKYSSRYIEVMLPMLALMSYIGIDEEEFLVNFSKSKQRFMEQLEHSDTDDIFMALMNSTYKFGITINSGEPTQLHSILRNGQERGALNGSNTGFFFYDKVKYLQVAGKNRNWLVCHWPTIANGLFRQNPIYRGKSSTALKEQANRSKLVISDEIYNKAKAFRKAERLDTVNFDPQYVTVYDITSVIEGDFNEALLEEGEESSVIDV